MSELHDVQRAAGQVFDDFWNAHEKGEISTPLLIGIQLMITAICLKNRYREGGLKIVREYFDTWEFDYLLTREQIDARIYEYVQLERIKNSLMGDEE